MCSQHAKVYPYFIYLNFFIKGTFSKLLEFKRWKTVNLLTFSLSDDKNVPVYSCVEPLREQSCVCSCTANFGATMLLSRELKSLATSESLKRLLTNAFFFFKKNCSSEHFKNSQEHCSSMKYLFLYTFLELNVWSFGGRSFHLILQEFLKFFLI